VRDHVRRTFTIVGTLDSTTQLARDSVLTAYIHAYITLWSSFPFPLS
jgi:hypothetical protein